MERPGFFRKYVILEQLDPGFGTQRTPDGFARIEGFRNGFALSLQVRFLKEREQPYTVILIYDKESEIGVFRIGTLQIFSGIGSFRRFLDYAALKSLELKPEKIKFVLVASEDKDRISIPLAGCCKKNENWDESLRKRLLSGGKTTETKDGSMGRKEENRDIKENRDVNESRDIRENKKAENMQSPKTANTEDNAHETHKNRADDKKLENMLKETFESMDPFSNPRHDYSWYRVNDIARLSNILFSCGLTIPLFANPRILVGLFKYRHLLAGLYRSDINNLSYFVLGVPAKDETDGNPFENICRWVPVKNPDFGDMTGYWLVYISLKDGEFVT